MNTNTLGWIGAAAGIRSAQQHAERVSAGWTDRALDALRTYATRVNGEFHAPEVRKWAYDIGLDAPPEPRAWGAVFLRARKAGIIEPVGFVYYGDEVSHAQPVRTWRKAA